MSPHPDSPPLFLVSSLSFRPLPGQGVAVDTATARNGERRASDGCRPRAHYVKARVKVHAYPDGEFAIFHGPRLLARYDRDGALTGSREVKTAACQLRAENWCGVSAQCAENTVSTARISLSLHPGYACCSAPDHEPKRLRIANPSPWSARTALGTPQPVGSKRTNPPPGR
jgi:hypothetical protein